MESCDSPMATARSTVSAAKRTQTISDADPLLGRISPEEQREVSLEEYEAQTYGTSSSETTRLPPALSHVRHLLILSAIVLVEPVRPSNTRSRYCHYTILRTRIGRSTAQLPCSVQNIWNTVAGTRQCDGHMSRLNRQR